MSSLKTILAICFQNFRKWQTDYRMWTIAALLITMVQISIGDISKVAEALETDMPLWVFPFLYNQFHTKVIYTLPVILMFCNAPFVDNNQVFIYMRCGRIKWLCGQIFYIIIASAAYYLFILIVSLASAALHGAVTLEWGKTLTTIANSGISSAVGAEYVEVPSIILAFFTPLQAVMFTFLVSWLSAVLLGLTVFFFNFITRTQFVGITISSLMVVWTIAVANGLPKYLKFSPISWNTLDQIDVGGMTANPSFTYCMCVYMGLIFLLISAILVFGRKKNLGIKGE